MGDINRIILLGRLGTDPVLNQSASGRAFLRFPLATQVRGQQQHQWHRITAFGAPAIAAAALKKGQTCYLEGKVVYRRYQRADAIRYRTEVVADHLHPIGPGPSARPSAA